jgi:FkbM family methyltransferase
MFVSYAQNFEDVMLWRALGKLRGGFYIDIGAYDPTVDSVTKAFYVNGWRGINVEPLQHLSEKYATERPDDINLRVVISNVRGLVDFYNVSDSGLSTTKLDLVRSYQAEGRDVRVSQVESETLSSICERYACDPIHFLKIDVGGSERDVLLGMDFDRWRPWILLIEANKPNSRETNHGQWEYLVLQSGYVFAYSDGLNRFYVAKEHEELLEAFEHPPNVFDSFVLGVQSDALCRAQQAETHAQQAEHRAQEAESELYDMAHRAQQAELELEELDALMQTIYRSRSWRITAPLRALGNAMHRRRPQPLPGAPARPVPTLFIECTDTYGSDLNTGIQRVVRNVLRNAEVSAARYGFAAVPVVLENKRLVPVNLDQVVGNKLSKDNVQANAPGHSRSFSRSSWQLLLRALATMLPFASVERFVFAAPDRFGLAWSILLPLRVLRLRPWPKRTRPDEYERYDGSILVLLDASWNVPIWPAVKHFKRRGGKIVAVIHDLIPITHPNAFMPNLRIAFRQWLEELMRHAEAFIGNSRSTAEQVAQFRAALAEKDKTVYQPAAIDHFYLGSELDLIDLQDEPRPKIREIFDVGRHVFLIVGSFEPRKNHNYVLDAFDAYWASGGDAALVMIGRQAWKADILFGRVANHKELDQRLFVVRDATDADLNHAYLKASALIIASLVEGFGLPIAEALQRGLPVLCSDIPVFREIAEGKATFFDLSQSSRLADALEEFCNSRDVRQRGARTPYGWLTWRQSTDLLCAAIMRALGFATVDKCAVVAPQKSGLGASDRLREGHRFGDREPSSRYPHQISAERISG